MAAARKGRETVRVRVSFYYDTSAQLVRERPDYRRSVAASLREAILWHGGRRLARRVREVRVRVERVQKGGGRK